MLNPCDPAFVARLEALVPPGRIIAPEPRHLEEPRGRWQGRNLIAATALQPSWKPQAPGGHYGYGFNLGATEAGLDAIGIEPLVASAVASARKAKPSPQAERTPDGTATLKPVAIRAGTKQARIIALLQRPEGATVAEMVEATSWQAHTVRGSISGALKKKLGLPVAAEKVEGRGTVYRLP